MLIRVMITVSLLLTSSGSQLIAQLNGPEFLAPQSSARRHAPSKNRYAKNSVQEIAPNRPIPNSAFDSRLEFGQSAEPVFTQPEIEYIDTKSVDFLDSHYRFLPNPTGNIPFVTGDIFGVSREQCCDEWKGHCRCLELTSSLSNCECTNPYRAHWGNGTVDDDCESCREQNYSHSDWLQNEWVRDFRANPSRTASNYQRNQRVPRRRSNVSDYFHPQRR